MERILLLVDVQREFSDRSRPFHIHNVEESLFKIQYLLDRARGGGWEIMHVRHEQDDTVFVRGTTHANYVTGFEPVGVEREFVKSNFSCYSDESFSRMAAKRKETEFFVVGYSTTMCVAATIIEGYHRGNRFTLLADCSNAKADGGKTGEELHSCMCVVLSRFARVALSTDILSS